MKKLLNVLYVTTPQSYLALDGENVLVLVEQNEKLRLPIHTIESIVCFGYMGASPALMGMCADRNIGLCFLTPSGKFLARVSGPVRGNILLRKKQYRMSENLTESLTIAKNFIIGKLVNSRAVIERGLRDHAMQLDTQALKQASLYLKRNFNTAKNCRSHEELRGVEGDCAKTYFGVFNELILHQKESFCFTNRNRRPPKDNVNTLLSFFYTLLTNDVQAALESVGIDPFVGFLHRDRPGRPSLALDMMEELRAFMADRLALSLINRKQINQKGFTVRENGAVMLDDDTRKEILIAWQKRKQEEITHPYLQEKISIGLIPYAQSLLLARFLRGDLDEYPPFLWK